MSIVCAQIGAREHYAIPRVLHQMGLLDALVTDAWVAPTSPLSVLPGVRGARIRERYHPALDEAHVVHFNVRLLLRELLWMLSSSSGWQSIMARNDWFQTQCASVIANMEDSHDGKRILFAHSYAAGAPFRAAKRRGWATILGQIDPGEMHFDIVERAYQGLRGYGRVPERPPKAYFDSWRQECAMADRILVNSEWSRECLERQGIPLEKIIVVPLAYEGGAEAIAFQRQYPASFSKERPIRILFVGHAGVPKGLHLLLQAVDALPDIPWELRVAGLSSSSAPSRFRTQDTITWLGPIPRSEVMRHYREADVLVFPTLSDGFGLVQVEAQAWKLPVIASRCCGTVVQDGVNGIVIPEASMQTIAQALRAVVERPRLLDSFAQHSTGVVGSGLRDLGGAIMRVAESLRDDSARPLVPRESGLSA